MKVDKSYRDAVSAAARDAAALPPRREFEPIMLLDESSELPESSAADCRIKRLAAQCGRRLGHSAAFWHLVDAYKELPWRSIRWWSRVVLIDDRWQGATGQGGYWAAASEAANRAALQALFELGVCGYSR